MDFEHLKDTETTYRDHFCHSLSVSGTLFTASIKNLVHAIYPDAFETSASDAVKELYEFLFPRQLEMKETEKLCNNNELP